MIIEAGLISPGLEHVKKTSACGIQDGNLKQTTKSFLEKVYIYLFVFYLLLLSKKKAKNSKRATFQCCGAIT